MADDFTATIGDWTEQVDGAQLAIFQESTQELVQIAQTTRSEGGRMRVDTGFLRNSINASTAAMPQIDPKAKPAKGSSYSYNSSSINAIIAGTKLGDTIYVGWTAAYAAAREFGVHLTNTDFVQGPDAFARTAAQQWPDIVERKTAELKGRLGL